MRWWSLEGIAALAACAVACGRAGPGAGAEPADVQGALAAVEHSRACAAALSRLAADDPERVARALEIEPARLAPFTRGARTGPVRQEIAERLEDARANAAAAQALDEVLPEDRAGPSVDERAARSVAIARGICRSAEQVVSERVATGGAGPARPASGL